MSERSQLIDRLTNNKETREAYIRSKVSTNVASQIRALRRREELTQGGLAEVSGMKQSRISAMERPGTRLNIETLVRLAAAFKIGLTVRFESFSEMLKWENGFSQDEFEVAGIDDDLAFRFPGKQPDQETETTGAVIASWANSQPEEAVYLLGYTAHLGPTVPDYPASPLDKNREILVSGFFPRAAQDQQTVVIPAVANAIRETKLANAS